MSTFTGEFIGTMLLIILGNGVVGGVVLNHSKAKDGGWVVVTIAWGLAVTMAIYAVGNISGAHINPAVTLSFAATGNFPWGDVPAYLTAQMLGAFTGAVIVWLHYLPHWAKTKSPEDKLAVFATGPAIRSVWANLFSEMVGTFILIAGLLFIGANKFTEGLNPLVVGLLILVIGMSLGGTTGYAINPARDLGPRIAHFILPVEGKGSSDWGYSWIPVVGPLLGGAMGAFFYQAVFQAKTGIGFWVVTALVGVVIIMAVREENKKQPIPHE